jgi:hypothetical protein
MKTKMGFAVFSSVTSNRLSRLAPRARRTALAGLAVALALLPVRPAPAQTNGYIPLFQYAIFYNSLLEFTTANTLTVNGPVRVNGNIYWGSSQNLTFNDTLTCSGAILETNWAGQSTNQFTGLITCHGVPPYITNAPLASLSFGVSNSPSTFHGMIEMPPLNEEPDSPMGQLRYYNKAQVVIVVSNSTVSALVQNTSNYTTLFTNLVVKYNPTNLAATNFAAITNQFPFLSLTNYFTDQRESKIVKVSQIDIGTLNRWLRSSFVTNYYPVGGGSYPNTFYIADERTDAGTTNGTEMIAVRLTNGVAVPTNGCTGFTLATPNPLYVWGNYNAQNPDNLASTNVNGVMPASLVCDALTILSASWQDRTGSNSVSDRPAATTTVDAALLAGIVYSVAPAGLGPPSQYSGGVVNFPRLLEDWTGSSLWLNTSLVNLFPSMTATNQFQMPGAYYEPPARQFAFNPNYETTNGLPPATPLICTNSFPYIITQPQSQTVIAGSNALFTVTAYGNAPLRYYWFHGANYIPGVTNINSSLVLTNVQASEAGAYWVEVLDAYGGGGVASSNAYLTVIQPAPPSITQQPASQTVCAGSNAAFSVSAAGAAPLAYQWLFDGVDIAGATNSALTVANVQSAQAGTYSVLVTNVGGATLSSNALLSLAVAPALAAQPQSQSILAGGQATFSITVTGTPPFSYQWMLNGTNLPAGLISTLAGNGVGAGTGLGGYSGDGGPATNASLNVPLDVAVDGAGNVFLADAENARIRKVGTNGIITTAAGNGTWGYSGDGQAATNAELNYPSGIALDAKGDLFLADEDNDAIREVKASGVITTLTNGPFLMFRVARDSSGNLFIAEQANQVLKLGSNGVMTVVAGTGQTGFSGDGGTATNATLNDPCGVAVDANGNLYIADAGNNRIRAVNPNGIITTVAGNGAAAYAGDGGVATNASLSQPAYVAVDAAGDLFIADGANGRIREVNASGIITTVAGNGTNGFSGDGGDATQASLYYPNAVAVDAARNLFISDYVNQRIRRVTSTQGPTLTINGVNANNAGNYQVVVTGMAGSVTSSVAVLTALLPPAITTQPASQTLAVGGTAVFSVATSGSSPISYQWFVDSTNVIAGADEASLVLTNVQLEDSGGYFVVVSNAYGEATSVVATLTVELPPAISVQPQSLALLVGQDADFLVSATGAAPLSYQWQCNGTNLVAATDDVLTLFDVGTVEAGAYSVIISNAVGCVTSSNALLSVYLTPAATLGPAASLAGNQFQFSVAGVPGFTYAVQASTDLINWVSLCTNTSPFVFADTKTAAFPQRYYRSVYLP